PEPVLDQCDAGAVFSRRPSGAVTCRRPGAQDDQVVVLHVPRTSSLHWRLLQEHDGASRRSRTCAAVPNLKGEAMPIISRGFKGRRRDDAPRDRVPPGQYVTDDFPVLSAGPTPHTPLDEWDFTIVGEVDERRRWTWDELRAL